MERAEHRRVMIGPAIIDIEYELEVPPIPAPNSPEILISLRVGVSMNAAQPHATPIVAVKYNDDSLARLNEPKRKRVNRQDIGISKLAKTIMPDVILTLYEFHGPARVSEVIEKLLPRIKPQLTLADYERVPPGNEEKWRKAVHFARLRARDQGLIQPNSPRGIWELTEAGDNWAEEQLRAKRNAQARTNRKRRR